MGKKWPKRLLLSVLAAGVVLMPGQGEVRLSPASGSAQVETGSGGPAAGGPHL